MRAVRDVGWHEGARGPIGSAWSVRPWQGRVQSATGLARVAAQLDRLLRGHRMVVMCGGLGVVRGLGCCGGGVCVQGAAVAVGWGD